MVRSHESHHTIRRARRPVPRVRRLGLGRSPLPAVLRMRHSSLIVVDVAAALDAFVDAVEAEEERAARHAAASLLRFAQELDEAARSW